MNPDSQHATQNEEVDPHRCIHISTPFPADQKTLNANVRKSRRKHAGTSTGGAGLGEESKGRTGSQPALRPNLAAVGFDDLPGDG